MLEFDPHPEVCEAINFVGDSGPGFAQADFDNMKERLVINVTRVGCVKLS